MCPGSCSFPFADLELHRTTTRTCSIASLSSGEGLDKKHVDESYRRRIGPSKKPRKSSRSRVWKPKQLGSSLDCPAGSCCFYPKRVDELLNHLNAGHKEDKVEEERLEKANIRQCGQCRSYLGRNVQCCVRPVAQDLAPDDVPPLVRPLDESPTSTPVDSQRATIRPGDAKKAKMSEFVPRRQLMEQKTKKQCGMCDQVFSSERQLMTHPCRKKRAPTTKEKFQFVCLNCEDWKSNNRKPFYEHLNDKHGGVKWPGSLLAEWGLLQCSRCGKVLIQMKRHEKGCTGRATQRPGGGSEEPRVLPSEEASNQVGMTEMGQPERSVRLTSVNTATLTVTDGDMMEEENTTPREQEVGLDSGERYSSNARGATLANIGDLLSQNSCERSEWKTGEEETLTHPTALVQGADEEHVMEEQGEEEIRQGFDPRHVQYVPHLWRSVPEHLWGIWRDICRPRLQAITIAHHRKDLVMMQSAIVDLLATASETLRRIRGARSIQKAHTGLENQLRAMTLGGAREWKGEIKEVKQEAKEGVEERTREEKEPDRELRRIQKATTLVHEGHVRKAVRSLFTEGVPSLTEDTMRSLRELHPRGPPPSRDAPLMLLR